MKPTSMPAMLRFALLALAALLSATTAARAAPPVVGYALIDGGTGKLLAQSNPDLPMIPASVAKLPTAIVALSTLGPDYRFVTRLVATGAKAGPSWTGDLYLVGGGDPLLSADNLRQLAETLVSQGVTRVNGRFFYDEGALPRLPRIDASQPESVPYNPGISALSVNFNRLIAGWTRAKDGSMRIEVTSPAAVNTLPTPWIGMLANPLPAAAPMQRDPSVHEGWLYAPGLLEPKGMVNLPVADAGLNAALLFRAVAAKAGLTVTEPRPGRVPPTAPVIAAVESQPLAEIVRLALRYSNNMTAELIGLAASTRMAGAPPATLAQSAALHTDWLKHAAPQVDWRGFVLPNHSGLTPAGRATPRQLAELVRLSGADLQGLMKSMATDGENAGIEGKTGTMYFAVSLAGQIRRPDNAPLYFAVMLVDWQARAAQEALPMVRPAGPPPGAVAWRDRARKTIKTLTQDWQQGKW